MSCSGPRTYPRIGVYCDDVPADACPCAEEAYGQHDTARSASLPCYGQRAASDASLESALWPGRGTRVPSGHWGFSKLALLEF